MVKIERKDLKGIVVPLGVGFIAFIGIFFYPGSFFIHPTFDVKVDHLGKITITNTGWVQAKNVWVQLLPSDLTGLSDVSCPELTSISKTNYTDIVNAIKGSKEEKFTFESALVLDRMSSNLSCEFKPFNNEGELTKVTVTADNSPPYVWDNTSNQTKSLIDINQEIFYLTVIVAIASIATAISRFFILG